jgi:hypothetical protein
MEDGNMQEVKTIFVDEHGREIGMSNENVVITSMGDHQVTSIPNLHFLFFTSQND